MTSTLHAYVVGIIAISYGSPRHHSLTYSTGHSNDDGSFVGGIHNCPCAKYTGRAPPEFVGQDYYCESGITSWPWLVSRQHNIMNCT